MKKIFITTLLFALQFCANCQSFEGKIVYKCNYKSKLPNVSDTQFTQLMGNTQEYFIANGNYKSIANGTFFQSQTYLLSENKLFSKMANSMDYLWNDCAVNTDVITKFVINKSVTKILGYNCDELILYCTSGVQKYYYNSKFAIDVKVFVTHKYGNWYEFVSKSKALPLKYIMETKQFVLETIAVSVEEKKLVNSFFELPLDAKTIKSPF